jgi:RNA polymerase sigma-70 factor (ECF subfamily)
VSFLTQARVVESTQTTVAVQEYLDELSRSPGGAPSEDIIRALLGRAVMRLQQLCAGLLYRRYPRLAQAPLNLEADEVLSGVVERLLKAMRNVRPRNVRQFFALANQHIRWELNDLARRLDAQRPVVELRESLAPAPPQSSVSQLGATARRMLDAIEALPADEREVFELVRIQGMTHVDAASVLGISPKTVQRRLNRGLVLLADQLRDLQQPRADEP